MLSVVDYFSLITDNSKNKSSPKLEPFKLAKEVDIWQAIIFQLNYKSLDEKWGGHSSDTKGE